MALKTRSKCLIISGMLCQYRGSKILSRTAVRKKKQAINIRANGRDLSLMIASPQDNFDVSKELLTTRLIVDFTRGATRLSNATIPKMRCKKLPDAAKNIYATIWFIHYLLPISFTIKYVSLNYYNLSF